MSAQLPNNKVLDLLHLKILTPKQMLPRLPITLSQLKADNKTEGLLNDIIEQYNKFNKIIKQNAYYILNSKCSKTSDSNRLFLNLSDKISLKRSDKNVTLSNLRIYYTRKNIKKSYKGNTFKISALPLNEKLELPDGSFSVSDIQDYFKYIIKNLKQ